MTAPLHPLRSVSCSNSPVTLRPPDAPKRASAKSAAPPAAPAMAPLVWSPQTFGVPKQLCESATLTAHSHARAHGLPAEKGFDVAALVEAELVSAHANDHKHVTLESLWHWTRLANKAQRMPINRLRVLSATTRNRDEKFRLDLAIEALLAHALRSHADVALFLDTLAREPRDPHNPRALPQPQSFVELLGLFTRQLIAATTGGSLQTVPADPARRAFVRALNELGSATLPSMGGAGAFMAKTLAALSPKSLTLFRCRDKMTQQMRDHFGSLVRAADDLGRPAALDTLVAADGVVRTNYGAEFVAGTPFRISLPPGTPQALRARLHETVLALLQPQPNEKGVVTTTERAHSEQRLAAYLRDGALSVRANSRVISKTRNDERLDLGMSEAGLTGLARNVELALFARKHHLTSLGSRKECVREARRLVWEHEIMRAANPELDQHDQYVDPTEEDLEIPLNDVFRGVLDSRSMNAVEAGPYLQRAAMAGQTVLKRYMKLRGDAAESPAVMVQAAVDILRFQGLREVRLHGYHGDVKVTLRPVSPERQILALLRSRQAAANKAGTPNGELEKPADFYWVAPTVGGEALGKSNTFAAGLTAAGCTSVDRQQAERLGYHQEGQLSVFYVPSRGIHNKQGGTTSCGDVMDSVEKRLSAG